MQGRREEALMGSIRSKWVAAITLALTYAMVTSHPVMARTDCATEKAALQQINEPVRVTIDAPPNLSAGGSLRVSWHADRRVAQKIEVYLVFAIPGEVRFEAPPLPPRPAKDPNDLTDDFKPDLPGFIALPPQARGPLGLAFGQEKSRALVPLYQPGSKLDGSFAVRIFDAADLAIDTAVVARTTCGEEVVSQAATRTIAVAPGKPEIVVQDPYDIEEPNKIIIANSGRYRAHLFEDSYRVFDIATGAKLIDRAGHDFNFSPTARFVVAEVGDKGSNTYEVIDLVAREVVATPTASFVGWVHGDAYMISAQGSYGALTVRPTLISRPGPTDGDGLEFHHPGSCHACSSWTDDDFMLDLDNGILAYTGSFDENEQPVYELASGASSCCKSAGQLAGFVARTYALAPFFMAKGWHAREPIRFSQIYDPLADPRAKENQDQTWFQGAKPLRGQLLTHGQIDPHRPRLETAALSNATVVRGDWRSRVGRTEAGDTTHNARTRITSELSRLGLIAAHSAPRETIGFINSWAGSDRSGNPSAADEKRLDATIEHRTRTLEQRLIDEIPALKRYLGRRSTDVSAPYESPLPLEGLDKSKIYLVDTLEGAWRWQIDGRPVWLLQLWATEGNGGVGEGAMFLLQGEAAGARVTGGRIVDLTKPLEAFWSGAYGTSDHQTQLKPQVFLERYLVMASVAAHTICVIDLKQSAPAVILKDIPQADLLEDVVMSADARHVIQIDSDGQFFIHEVATGRLVLSGRAVDDEIIVYTPEGYYWSSYEGAHFVQLHFPGLPGLYPFLQFATALDRPDIIKGQLKAGAATLPAPTLVPPPSLELTLTDKAPQPAQLDLLIRARSTAALSRLRLYGDGQLIDDWSVAGTELNRKISLPRTSNARWITAQVTDTNGFVSTPQAIRLAPTGTPTSILRGVVVGINIYGDPRFNLKFARSDAERLDVALTANAGHYYAHTDVTPLLDADATKDAILSALRRVVETAAASDTIVFSFAGHGLEEDGHYYLTPSGFDVHRIADTGLAWADIASVLHEAKARVIVILDACHAGLTGSEGVGTNDDAVSALLSAPHPPMLVLAASKGRQVSFEHAKWGGGVFTFAMVEALQRHRATYDLDRDGLIEASELYRAVKSVVARETQGQQSPWLVRQDLLGDFALF